MLQVAVWDNFRFCVEDVRKGRYGLSAWDAGLLRGCLPCCYKVVLTSWGTESGDSQRVGSSRYNECNIWQCKAVQKREHLVIMRISKHGDRHFVCLVRPSHNAQYTEIPVPNASNSPAEYTRKPSMNPRSNFTGHTSPNLDPLCWGFDCPY